MCVCRFFFTYNFTCEHMIDRPRTRNSSNQVVTCQVGLVRIRPPWRPRPPSSGLPHPYARRAPARTLLLTLLCA